MTLIAQSRPLPDTNTLVDIADADGSMPGPALSGYAARDTIVIALNVSAASGSSPTLDVDIETSSDGVTWSTLASFTQATGVTSEILTITDPHDGYIRARWTVGGTTPSFDFTVRTYEAAVPALLEGTAASASADGTARSAFFLPAGPFVARLNVSAASGGTPTLDVDIQTSDDGVTWDTLVSFTQATGATEELVEVGLDYQVEWIRAVSTIGGTTPAFTFTVEVLNRLSIVADRAGEDKVTTSDVCTGYAHAGSALAQLEVDAATGTLPTLDVVLQHSVDGGTNWSTLTTFTQKAAAGVELKTISAPIGDHVRARCTLGGTSPVFDFNVKLVAFPRS